ncbi:acetyl-CoA carboxylase biotin carboxyl carrier protein [Yanghanlia caeni]|uniref:Biotin carboxyl carrier protein of acetyl-CoA carboxylase n=1 Tax=Yanghanlia caeni TaxID=3064283 RepID=A0ABU1D9M3_9BURK|nr:acetyl-CoA carboxylase biotin carboxyl carrier protein [Alcaligenaceae bacterium LG-2]
MSIDRNDVHRILKLVDETERFAEVDIELDGLRLRIVRQAGSAQATESTVAPPARLPNDNPSNTPAQPTASTPSTTARPAAAPIETSENIHVIKAPLLGTFYRSPAPGEKPFVEVGQRVKADDTLCIIEVMKLFNSLEAGVEGIVKEIRANDSDLVEFGQALFLIQVD